MQLPHVRQVPKKTADCKGRLPSTLVTSAPTFLTRPTGSCRAGQESGRRRHQVQGGRHGRGRLHGRTPAGPARAARTASSSTATRAGRSSPTISPDRRHRARDLRRLLGQHRRRPAFRAARLRQARPGRGRAAAVRRHHDLFAAAALGRRPGQEGRHRRPRRARPHGREVRARVRRPHGAVHDVAAQDRGRASGWARDEVVVSKDADEMAKHARQLRLDPEHGRGVARPRRRTSSLLKRDGTLVLVGAPEHPHPSPTCSACCSAAAAGRLGDRRHRARRRRCSTSAPRTTSSRTSS